MVHSSRFYVWRAVHQSHALRTVCLLLTATLTTLAQTPGETLPDGYVGGPYKLFATDVTGDGRPELFVRQAGGGPLRIYRNHFPDAGWLTVSLVGTTSNRQGIGARVIARLGDRVVRRELYPVINFLSQAPARVTLGLGQAKTIDRLTIRWPSGKVTEMTDVEINRHLLVREP